jgi:DNA-directed RNA polymerase specialized sigma24 family protein
MDADQELLQRCREGSEGAFRQLVERYQSAVFAALSSRVADPARTEQLAHEAFVRMYRGVPYLSGQVDVKEWIGRILLGLAAADVTLDARARGTVPAGFADRVLRAARRDWLQAEERLDWWFNAGIGGVVLLIGVGLIIVLQTSGFAGVFREFVRQLTGGS